MSNYLRHPFHLVDESPWPILASFRGIGLTSGLLKWFHYSEPRLFLWSLLFLLLVSFQWWRDISREGSLLGFHTSIVELGLRWGIILFIVSEVFFGPARIFVFSLFGIPFLKLVWRNFRKFLLRGCSLSKT